MNLLQSQKIPPDKRFWEKKSLAEMTAEEWDLLCDGCAICCLHKLEDEDSGEVFYTGVACRLLDIGRCRCMSYEDRFRQMPDCLYLTPETVKEYHWLPLSCAYRRLSEGKHLPDWHPLLSGNPDSVHSAGVSLRDRAISERYADTENLEAYVLTDVPFLPQP